MRSIAFARRQLEAIARSSVCALLSVTALSCAYDFDVPFSNQSGTGGADASADVTLDHGGDSSKDSNGKDATDAPAEFSTADQVSDVAPDVPDDSPQDVQGDSPQDAACAPGSKPCDGSCVPVDNPATGCAGVGCDPCLFDHGVALCIGGACALGQCENGFGNCDDVDGNGCETDTTTDPDHCGACGSDCAYPHASGNCTSGSCSFGACLDDWEDCNDNIGDGCEVNTRSDDNNCGQCGRVCTVGFDCNNTMCRCVTDSDCDTGGGGECDAYYKLCECSPYNYCNGPCTPTGGCSS